MMDENMSPEEERLRAALHKAADQVNPSPDGLAQIRRRTAESPWWRHPVFWGVTAGVATASAAIIIAASVLGSGDGGGLSVRPVDSPATTGPTTPSRESTDEPTRPPSPAETHASGDDSPPPVAGTTGDGTALPVYYVIDGDVTREWQNVVTDDPLHTAVDRALNGDPLDPRYTSPWAPVDVISVEVVDDIIEVDLAAPVELNTDARFAGVAVQQLVYTATAAAASTRDDVDGPLPVRILVDAVAPENLFGRLNLTDPVTRARQTDIRYPVQIDSPGYGARVAAPVTVTGVAALFEATMEWELRRDNQLVDAGTAMTEEASVFSEYHIDLGDLGPGEYEVTVREMDVAPGEGPAPRFDTKAFTVAG